MTTERRPSDRTARARVSPLELRLYVAALLALVYTIAWRAIGAHAPVPEPTATSPATPAATEPTLTTNAPPRYVWIDSVPPTARPVIALPAGWQLASETQPVVAPPTRVLPTRAVPAPRRRVPRVRTRSS